MPAEPAMPAEGFTLPQAAPSHATPSHASPQEEPPPRAGLSWLVAEKLGEIGDAQGQAARGGAALVEEGLDAFAVRAASARAATRTLDLQYYIWRGDVTGRLLAREVLAAADRGVKVRILLDDVYALGRERTLAALDAHQNIEVRLFNGTRWRAFGRLGLALEFIFGGWHLNRRMHNKIWLADDCVAITGGRNLGDEYFNASATEVNFRDLDIVLAGETAHGAGEIFTHYWECPLARPASLLSSAKDADGGLTGLRIELAAAAEEPEALQYLSHLGAVDDAAHQVARGLVTLAPGQVRVVADPPEKAKRGLRARRKARSLHGIAPEIANTLRVARHEAWLISPYFVPGKAGLALLLSLARRGVKVSVVTNSLAATDVVAVHGGYAKYRKPLLAAGVEIFELKPTGDQGASILGSRGASLHTKALVVDDDRLFVGSFNLDPRSAALNTEMGAFVSDRTLAQELREECHRLSDPARSWRLALADGKLSWSGDDEAGRPVVLRHEPDASFTRRLVASIVRRLPVESQL